MQIGMIWAEDHNRVLGSGTDMFWRVPADFKHFKESTLGSPVVMGRRSWEALGRPLPGRTNVVLTRQPATALQVQPDRVYHDLESALTGLAAEKPDLIWITGGAQIYEQALPFADFLLISKLDLVVPDTGEPKVYAPKINPDQWILCPKRSDPDWRPVSGDARWRIFYYYRNPEYPAVSYIGQE